MCCGRPEVSLEARGGGKWWREVTVGPITMHFGSQEPAEEFLSRTFPPESEYVAVQAALRFQKELAEAA